MKPNNRAVKILEALIAAVIFVVVILSASSSLISMNGNNRNLELLTSASSCSEEIQSAITEYFNYASGSDSKIFGLEENQGNYSLSDISLAPGKRGKYAGFVVFSKQSDSSYLANAVIKKYNDSDYSYFALSSKVDNEKEIKNNILLGRLVKIEDFKSVTDCKTMEKKSSVDLKNPFNLDYIERYDSSHNNIYEIEVSDFIYPPNNKSVFSRLFIKEGRIL